MANLKYYGLEKKDYDSCKQRILEANKNVVSYVLVISLIMLLALIILSYLFTFLNAYQVIYYGTFFGLLLLIPIFKFLHKFKMKNKNLISSYLLMTVLFTFGIVVATPTRDKSATVFISLLLILPILFIDNLMRMSIFVILMSTIFSIVTFLVKTPPIAGHDIITCLGYTTIVLFFHYLLSRRNLMAFISDRNSNLAIQSYQEIQNELKVLIQKDLMTGLYNHVAFIETAKELLKKINNSDDYIALGIMDLDNFKNINDNFGHQLGDAVIVKVAEILKENMSEYDIVGRLGGDEYIFLLVNMKGKKEVELRLEKLVDEIINLGKKLDLDLCGSIGIVLTNNNNEKVDSLYSKADIALYNAKNSGKNHYSFYDDIHNK